MKRITSLLLLAHERDSWFWLGLLRSNPLFSSSPCSRHVRACFCCLRCFALASVACVVSHWLLLLALLRVFPLLLRFALFVIVLDSSNGFALVLRKEQFDDDDSLMNLLRIAKTSKDFDDFL